MITIKIRNSNYEIMKIIRTYNTCKNKLETKIKNQTQQKLTKSNLTTYKYK